MLLTFTSDTLQFLCHIECMSNNIITIYSAFLLLELLIFKDKQQHLTNFAHAKSLCCWNIYRSNISAGIPQSSGVQIKQDLCCAWSGPFVVFVLFWCFSVLIKNYHHEYRLPHSPKMDKKYCIRLLSHWKVKLYSRLSFLHNFWKCFYCWRQWLSEEIYFWV